MSSYLQLQQVAKSFGETTVLKNIDLDIAKGEFVTLLGPSGCGKTTTLSLIAGFQMPTSGRIAVGGVDVTAMPSFKRNLGVVFQDYALFPHMSVADNIGYGLRTRKVDKAEATRRIGEAIEMVHLTGLGARMPSELSGGQRQRVALARAIVIRPALLLLDEPLSNLDLKLREIMRSEIASLQRELKITTVFVTHDQTEALDMSDRIVVMHKGAIAQIGTPEDIYDRPLTREVAAFIGQMNFVPQEQGSIGFRPENVLVDPAEIPDGAIALEGTVMRSAYLGQRRELHLSCRGANVVVHSTRTDIASGDTVRIVVPGDQCRHFA